MKKWQVVTIVLLILAVSLSAFACAPKPPAEAKTLKLGLIVPLTGAGASWGIPIEKTARLYFDEVNAAGGIKVAGEYYKIDLIPYDGKYVAAENMAAAERLIYSDKVKYILGPISSAGGLVVVPYCDEKKVVTLAINMASPLGEYSFRVLRHSSQVSMGLVSYIAEAYPEWKRFALTGPDDATGWGQTADEIQMIHEIIGVEPVALEFWARGTKDFYPLLTKLRAANPDVVMTDGTSTAEQAMFAKQAAELGWKVNWANHGVTDIATLLSIASKEDVEGMIVTSYIHDTPDTPELCKEWKAKYIARWGTFDESSILWYEDVSFFHKAMENSKSIDVDDFVASAEKLTTFPVLYGDAILAGKAAWGWNHGVFSPLMYCEIRDGKLVKVSLFPATEPPPFKLYPPATPKGAR